jgi:hypothetical protein
LLCTNLESQFKLGRNDNSSNTLEFILFSARWILPPAGVPDANPDALADSMSLLLELDPQKKQAAWDARMSGQITRVQRENVVVPNSLATLLSTTSLRAPSENQSTQESQRVRAILGETLPYLRLLFEAANARETALGNPPLESLRVQDNGLNTAG